MKNKKSINFIILFAIFSIFASVSFVQSQAYFTDRHQENSSIDIDIKRNVTFVANGVTISPTGEYSVGSEITLPTIPENSELGEPSGWVSTVDKPGKPAGTLLSAGDKYLVTFDEVYTAQYEDKKVLITFDDNMPSGYESELVVLGMPSDVEVSIDKDYTLKSQEPTFFINRFLGYNTKRDGSGDNYNAGSVINLNEDTTLYAQWTIRYFEITGDGGFSFNRENLEIEAYTSLQTLMESGDLTGFLLEAHPNGIDYDNPEDVVYSAFMKLPKVIEIPVSLNNTHVRYIADNAFSQLDFVERYVFNSSIDSVGARAFQQNYALTSIELPETVVSIGEGAFNQSGLTSFDFPSSVTLVGDGAFASTMVEEIIMPENVIWGELVFQESKLRKVTLPNDMVTIPYGTFIYNSIEKINIPNSVKEISNNAFDNNDTLKEVIMTDSVVKIGDNAFGNTSIELMRLSNSIEEIGLNAFSSYQIHNGLIKYKGPYFVGLTTSSPTIAGYSFSNNWKIDGFNINIHVSPSTGNTTIQEVVLNGDSLQLTPVSKPGHTFVGWFTSQTGGTQLQSGLTPTSDMDIYDRWTVNKYNVVYNTNGGTNGPATSSVDYGSKITIGPAPTRTGYTFTGWMNKESGNVFQPGRNDFTVYGNVEFIAQWTINTYTATYNANGGFGAPSTQSKTHGQANVYITPMIPTRENYTFVSWNTAANGTGTTVQPSELWSSNNNLTLYAQWKLNTYSITYNANTGVGGPGNQIKNHGENLTLNVTIPTKEGYTFVSWNTISNGSGISYAPGATFTTNANTTLYAQWRLNTYSVTYLPGANDGSVYQMPTNNSKSHGIDYDVGLHPGRNHYKFLGWETEVNGVKTVYQPRDLYKDNRNTTFTALWEKSEVLVSYEAAPWSTASWGMGDNPSEWFFIGEGYILNNPGETTETVDKNFLGWKDKETGAIYLKGTSNAFTKDTVLIPHWEAKKVTITYELNGGSGSQFNQTQINYGTQFRTPSASPTRTNYQFAGWSLDNQGLGTTYSTNTVVSSSTTSNVKLYAHWNKIVRVNTTSLMYVGNETRPTSQFVISYKATSQVINVQSLLNYTHPGYTSMNLRSSSSVSNNTNLITSANYTVPADTFELFMQGVSPKTYEYTFASLNFPVTTYGKYSITWGMSMPNYAWDDLPSVINGRTVVAWNEGLNNLQSISKSSDKPKYARNASFIPAYSTGGGSSSMSAPLSINEEISEYEDLTPNDFQVENSNEQVFLKEENDENAEN